ncbi:protein hzfA [Aspergillus nidulans FGSC A4]|uniref:CCCH zinc finger protein (AFU_orthologue AFUA_8G05480) n=1 Tax=Emericella nidulans (strain FGSC A4 / ATCC 38163 / CBS 112.46 / NRRL 194 / M139) TaxID=227321 RepID=C8VMX4_EMENI|nr:protein hzfA [Aspergillus nidulans FGSC A4]CBF85065.1 TPA: CCCH zinc finger protein (AFU_orthologue; AFUA_8G05480) [Aspergillus nidulans FGSC A4]
MSEDQDLMARISQLAGQINRFKNGNTPVQSAHNEMHSNSHVSRHTSYRGRPGWAPYRGRPYGRGRGAAPHRHRTLILNNSATPASKSSTPPDGMAIDTDENSRSATPNAWVTKHARHMQLINSAVYDKEAQKRVKALEETRKAKAQKKAQIEQAKVLQFAHGAGRQFSSSSNPQVSAAGESHGEYQITLNDIPFRVSRGGGKLIRVSSATPVLSALIERAGLQIVDDPNTANNTPKRVKVAGVTFVRSKNGNLHRLGAVTSKRVPSAVKKKDELCQRFTTTGTCYKGPSCPYIHDPNKVAICKDFLQTGKCSAGNSCDLSHEPSPHRSPACVHFLRGRCSNPECRYAHVRVTPGAPVCRAFATLGYCDKGETCEERHVHECPDYANTGVCKKKHCRLPHVDRAGQIRKNAGPKEGEGDDESDASSEEEEFDEIGSDDVDSDYLSDEGELIEGTETGEVSKQQDFIRL